MKKGKRNPLKQQTANALHVYQGEKKNMSGCPFMSGVPANGVAPVTPPLPMSTFVQPAEELDSMLGFATTSPLFLPNQAGQVKQEAAARAAGKTPVDSPVKSPNLSGSVGAAAAASASAPSSANNNNSNNSANHHHPPRESITGACHYSEYLGLGALLALQEGPSLSKPGGHGMMHHEENLFVIVHQTFELWFRMVIVDLEKCRELMGELLDAAAANSKAQQQKAAATASAAASTATAAAGTGQSFLTAMNGKLSLCLNYLRRIEQIITHATGAFGIIETMHCGDFLEFRDYLLPASGFQSVQFRKLERELGLQDEPRATVNGIEVFKYLRPEEQESLDEYVNVNNINHLVNRLLATLNVPADFVETYQSSAQSVMVQQQQMIAKADTSDPKIQRLIQAYVGNLKQMLDDPVGWCEGLHVKTEKERAEFKKAVVSCLFVYMYRHEPEYAVLASVLEQLIAVEESLLVWRSRHLHMAERMIGRRTGTGGSSGVGYLDVTRRYRIFHALWLVRKLTIRSSALPPLSKLRDPASPLFD